MRTALIGLSLLFICQGVWAEESSADLLGLGTTQQTSTPAQTQTVVQQAPTANANTAMNQPTAAVNGNNTEAQNLDQLLQNQNASSDQDPSQDQDASQDQDTSQDQDASQNATASNPTVPTTPPPINPWIPANNNEAMANANAFRSVSQNAFPLSPDQINALRNMLDQTQRA